jgi:hypothetical protein
VGGVIVVVVAVVVGVSVVSGGGGGSPVAVTTPPSSTGAPSPSPSPSPPVAPPTGFTAKGKTVPFGVVLRWSPPSGQDVGGYLIYRGAVQIATVSSSDTSFTDSDVKPGKTYTYGIVARGPGLPSDRVSVEVKVPIPPLSAARLAGNFNAKLHSTSQYGYSGDVGDLTLGWNFKPKCAEGACDVTWKDLHFKELKSVLDRKGTNYSGSDSGKFFGQCSGVTGTSSVTLDLHVVKAKVIQGEWRATKLEGTFVESHPSFLGCTSGGAHFNATVSYVD